MKELSKEDQERIENAASDHPDTQNHFSYQGFIMGAEYEHPIARKEGFNEALEEVKEILMYGLDEQSEAFVQALNYKIE